jgi:hypothetical protein
MTDETPRIDREGIHIGSELAEEVAIDEELDSNLVGPYKFPDPGRRRVAAWLMFGFGLLALVAIPDGWPVSLGLAALGGWMLASSWPLAVDEHRALTVAGAVVPFPVGHASATVRFKGWRSRPRWSVVMYSATEPPDERALVVVDAVSGEVVEAPYVERIEPV